MCSSIRFLKLLIDGASAIEGGRAFQADAERLRIKLFLADELVTSLVIRIGFLRNDDGGSAYKSFINSKNV